MVEIEAPFPLDSQVDVDQVVSSGQKADKTRDEEYEPLQVFS